MLAVDESGFYFYLSCKLALIKWPLLMPLNYCIPFDEKVSCSKKKKKKSTHSCPEFFKCTQANWLCMDLDDTVSHSCLSMLWLQDQICALQPWAGRRVLNATRTGAETCPVSVSRGLEHPLTPLPLRLIISNVWVTITSFSSDIKRNDWQKPSSLSLFSY